MIYFYKLAQLLVFDILNMRNYKENIEVDYSHLNGCADYKIPQILRAYGILTYDSNLSKLVDNRVSIEDNSEYEIEIRANMVVAINLITTKLGYNICPIEVNNLIWTLSQNNKKHICHII